MSTCIGDRVIGLYRLKSRSHRHQFVLLISRTDKLVETGSWKMYDSVDQSIVNSFFRPALKHILGPK